MWQFTMVEKTEKIW